MKKLNNTVWLILTILSLLVGISVLIAEGSTHSKFYIYFIISPIFFLLWRKGGNQGIKPRGKKKKS